MVGPCAPATRVDMGRSSAEVTGFEDGRAAPSTFAPRRTWQGSRPPVTNRCIDKSERGNRRGVGPHHARPERNRKHVRLLDKKRPLIMSESALGADQHGERPGALGRKRGKRRSLRRSFVGKDQEPGGIPTIE